MISKSGDHVLAQGVELAIVEHIDPPSTNGRILVQVRLDKLPHTLTVPFFLEDLELVDDR